MKRSWPRRLTVRWPPTPGRCSPVCRREARPTEAPRHCLWLLPSRLRGGGLSGIFANAITPPANSTNPGTTPARQPFFAGLTKALTGKQDTVVMTQKELVVPKSNSVAARMPDNKTPAPPATFLVPPAKVDNSAPGPGITEPVPISDAPSSLDLSDADRVSIRFSASDMKQIAAEPTEIDRNQVECAVRDYRACADADADERTFIEPTANGADADHSSGPERRYSSEGAAPGDRNDRGRDRCSAKRPNRHTPYSRASPLSGCGIPNSFPRHPFVTVTKGLLSFGEWCKRTVSSPNCGLPCSSSWVTLTMSYSR